MSVLQGWFYPFQIIRGETFKFSFELERDGTKQFFDDYQFLGEVRDPVVNAILIAPFTITEDADDPTLMNVIIDSATSTAMVANDYVYEIRTRYTNDDDVVEDAVLFRGTFVVSEAISTFTQ